jgi:hypothetical protein
MTIAIEPMITAGGPDIFVHDDEWSISTVDGSLAAHFRAHGGDRFGGAARADEAAGSWYHDDSAASSRCFVLCSNEREDGD